MTNEDSPALRLESKIDFAKLRDLLGKATRGPWRIDTGLMGGDLNITACEREGFRREGDGAICHVSTERLHFSREDDHGLGRRESRSSRTPIKKARVDAELIVEAVNALPELLRRLGFDGAETGWLIEWPSDDYGPIRYWAAGHAKPVIDASKATRFSRHADAIAVMRALPCEKGCDAVEHMWMPPAQGIEAPSGGETGTGSTVGKSPVGNADAPEPHQDTLP